MVYVTYTHIFIPTPFSEIPLLILRKFIDIPLVYNVFTNDRKC